MMSTPLKSNKGKQGRGRFQKTSSVKGSSNDQIKKILSSEHPLPSVILLLSPDTIRLERGVDSLVEKFSAEHGISKEAIKNATTKLDCASLTPESIVALKENISSLSLFSPAQIFILRGIDKANAKITDEILTLSKGSLEKTLIILCGASLAATSKILKTFTALEQSIILTNPTNSEALKWLTKEAKGAELNCSSNFLSALVTIAESEAMVTEQPVLDILHARIVRLGLYLDGEEATLTHLEELFPDITSTSEFDFIDQVILGHIAKSEPLLSNLFKNGKNAFLLLSLFSRSLTNVLLVRFLLERGMSENEIKGELGINPWVLSKVIKLARAVPASKLLKASLEVLKLDNRLKGASLEEIHLFSTLIGNVARQ